MSKKVLFLAHGPPEWASSRYRMWWVAKYANWAEVVTVDDLVNGATSPLPEDDVSVVVFPKWYDERAQQLAHDFRKNGKQIIWDLCDPVWWFDPGPAREFLSLVDHVVFSNHGLQRDYRRALGPAAGPSSVVLDRMDADFHPTTKTHRENGAPVLLWYGVGANRAPSLQSALLGLHRLTAEDVRFRLRILDNAPPGNINIPGVHVEYHPWRLDTFHEELLAADVALCPRYPGAWDEMKSNNKKVTAWWAGLPTVGLDNAVDFDLEKQLITDADARASVGAEMRRNAEAMYDVRKSVAEWESLLDFSQGKSEVVDADLRIPV